MPPDLDSLPAALTTPKAAELLGLSDDSLERAAKRGDAPVPFYRWGRSLRWPTEPIRRLLNGEAAPHRNGTASELASSPTALTRNSHGHDTPTG